MQPAAPQGSTPLRRISLGAVALLVVLIVLLSCMGGEVTAPRKADVMYARGLRFNTIFPAAFQQSAFAGVVNFDRVRVVIRRPNGTVALDTTVNFPANVDEISLDLSVPLAGSSAEDLMVSLGYLNTANDTVFKGTKQITATPTLPGQPAQAPVTIPVVYTGPGATATAVHISPRQLTVNGGGTFAFTAVGVDASGATVANAPIAWSSLDPARATITSPAAGNGVALSQRGTARILATLISGQTDTALVTVNLPPSAIAAVSGSGQVGVIGKPTLRPFAQPLVVKVSAADGVGASGVTVNFAAATGGGSVSPASAVTDANGVAQTTWTPGNTTGAQTATATAAGLTGSPVTFTATVNQTVATKLVFTTAPGAGASIDAQSSRTFVVAAQDVDGDAVSTFTGNVSLSIGAGPTGAALSGTTIVAAVAGIATFSNIGIALPGTGYVISATSTGLANASSPTFNVINGAPTSLTLVSGGGQTAAINAVLSPITVVAKDAAGNPSPGATVAFAVASGGGSVTPASATTDASGQASATWTLGSTPGAQTMTATVAGLTPVTVSATATTTSTNNQVVVTQSPGTTLTAGVNVQQPLIAEVRTAAGALLTNYTGNVSIAIGNNPGGATLSGTTTVAAQGGVATFSAFSLNKAGAGYTIVVSTPGASNGTTGAFSVAPAGPASLNLISGGGQSGQPNTALPAPIVVRVDDAFGNAIDGIQVQFAVSAGGGSVAPASATTASGTARTTWTLGASGAQTLTITSPVLPNAPLSVSATFGPGAPVSTTVSPQRDTITAFTDTRTLTAQGRDAAGNLVAGSWTWVSRTPSVATVSASGVVSAVVDGSTYIVATEAGGSKDSSFIVVQQRIASINVNPASRSIYTTGNISYTAQAVDGRGVAMVTQPSFVWSSVNPSVATVNAASGVATGVNIGSTQIRATSGSTIGVANLTVLTPITRIDVTFDSTNAPAPDVFTMPSLGDRRMYRAIARDTLLNVMNGVTFTWTSTNGSVALIDSTTPTKARAVSAANGITTIQALAQGVTGGASLTVSQVLATIDLTPTTLTVGVTGSSPLTARGKDANGRYIPGGSFTFTSTTPSVATVNGTTGVVTGVANGTTNVTAASGNITSNAAVVSVNNSGASLISFGRDTLGIGRGTSQSVPIFLSKPNAAPVTVNIAVADTFAFFTTASVTIPAGQTAVNATLTGRNAGTTRVFAVDGSGTGFAGDTAVLAVQANLRMTTTFYSVSATDQVITQALLSDPSPAGGTFVTFAYGTAGRAIVSPDPAFIPAGQLAADVVIKGLVAGTTTVTPSAAGVSGTAATVSVGAAVLNINSTLLRLGQGQFDQFVTVNAPNTLNAGLTVNLSSTDSTIAATSSSSAVIPPGSSSVTIQPIATGRGTAKIYAAAPGWVTDSVTVIGTTPMARVTGGGTLNTTSGPSSFTVYAADSTRNVHYRVSSLAVRLSSSDTTVLRVIDTLLTIAPNSQSISGQVQPNGAVGTAWLKVTAGGHTPDSVLYTINGPKLSFSYTSNRLGAGQEMPAQSFQVYLQVPNPVAQALNVTLTSSDSSVVATAPVVTIPAGSTTLYFTIRGKAPGSATLIASATGYSPDTGTTVVTTPRAIFSTTARTMNAYSTSSISIFSADSLRTTHVRTQSLGVAIASLDTTVAKVDTVATILAGSVSSPAVVITAISVGTTKLVVTAAGHLPDTMTVTVQPAKLNFNFTTYTVGARQAALSNPFTISIPNARSVSVPVTLTQTQPSKVGLSSTSLTVNANTSSAVFNINGLVPGRDTIIASAPGYAPDTGVVSVSTPRLRANNIPGTATTTDPPYTVFLFVADSLNSRHVALDTIVVHAVSSDTNVIRPSQAYFHIDKGQSFVQPTIQFVGNGTANITYSDSAGPGYLSYTTNNVTVTGPSLTVGSNYGTNMLGMRQTSASNEYYVQVPNAVGQALTVNLVSTDTRVVSVPTTVTIPVGSSIAFFPVTANDTIGTIQLQATATGYSMATRNVQVTVPRFEPSITTQLNTTSPPSQFQVYAVDANGNSHAVAQDVAVTLQSSAPGVASIDSTTVTILAGQQYSTIAKWTPGSVGSATISAIDSRAVFYKYATGTQNVSVITPTTYLNQPSSALSPGQYFDSYVQVPDAPSTAMTVTLTHSASPHVNTPASVVIPAGQNYVYFRVAATSVGSDTVTASPPGHVSAKMVVAVGTGRFIPSNWPSTIRAGDSTQVYAYAADQTGNTHYVLANTAVTLGANPNFQFVSGGAGSTLITSVVIPADQQGVYVWIKGLAAGTASGTLSAPNYSTYTNTFTVTP